MAETTEKTGEKKLSVSPSKTLTLKGRGVEQGVVRQSFSHGRTKAVVVEKVKSRVPTRAKGDAPASSAAAAKRPATGKPAAPTAAAARPGARPALEPDEDEAPRARRGPGAARPAPAPKPARGGGQKSRGRLTLVTALSADEERERSVAAFRRRVQRLKGHTADEPKEKLVREVTIPETITIQELANRMAERSVDVIKLLMKQGHMAQINDVIDADTAQLLAEELGHTVKRVAESDVEEGLFDAADDRGDKSRQGGESADDRRDQQGRPARREAGAGAQRIASARDTSRVAGGPGPRCRGLGDQEAQHRPAARNHRTAIGNPRSQG